MGRHKKNKHWVDIVPKIREKLFIVIDVSVTATSGNRLMIVSVYDSLRDCNSANVMSNNHAFKNIRNFERLRSFCSFFTQQL